LVEGADEFIQLEALIASFIMAGIGNGVGGLKEEG
jgi:DNA polymerase III delta prime subunit